MSITSKKQTGFTIVELLIVIVVIGILAAITVTAYNGVQTRSENTKTTTAVKRYYEAIRMFAIDTGSYPIAPNPCLGPYDTNTRCANVGGLQTGVCEQGAGSPRTQEPFDTAVRQYFGGNPPEPSRQKMDCDGGVFSGAWYWSGDGKYARISYYLKGDEPCDTISGVVPDRLQSNQTTRCILQFPAP